MKIPRCHLKTVLILLAFQMSMQIACAQENRRDGNWWNRQSDVEKLTYLQGFFDGMDYQDEMWDFSLGTVASKIPKREFDIKVPEYALDVEKTLHSITTKNFANVTIGQLRDGLDQLYADYKNRRIKIYSAMTIVLRSIDGTPKDELEQIIEIHRKNASE